MVYTLYIYIHVYEFRAHGNVTINAAESLEVCGLPDIASSRSVSLAEQCPSSKRSNLRLHRCTLSCQTSLQLYALTIRVSIMLHAQ